MRRNQNNYVRWLKWTPFTIHLWLLPYLILLEHAEVMIHKHSHYKKFNFAVI